MSDQNMFGGGNKNSLYVPMSEIEQEVLHRLKERGDYRVHIKGWGVVENPHVIVGDLRLSVQFQLEFNRPETPMPVYFMDMELRTGSGRLLTESRRHTMVNGGPMMVSAGMITNFAWEIAMTGLDPQLVREVMPEVTGLTSRQMDKDSREFTSEGNMRLSASQKLMLRKLREGESLGRKVDAENIEKMARLALARKKPKS